jgi:PAS domain S-box-containing protein
MEETMDELKKLEKGAPIIMFKNRFRCKNGEYRAFMWCFAPDKKHQIYYATAKDITKEIQSEKSKTSISAPEDTVIKMDKDGNILDVEDSTEDELIPFQSFKNIKDVLNIKEGKECIVRIKEVLTKDEVSPFSHEILFKDKLYYFEGRLLKSDENEVVYILRNVTPRMHAELLNDILLNIAETSGRSNMSIQSFCKEIQIQLSKLMPVADLFVSQTVGSDSIQFVQLNESDPNSPGQVTTRKKGNGLTDYILKSCEPLILKGKQIKNFQKDKGLDTYIGSASKCWIGTPLLSSGNTIGVIVCQSYSDTNAYNETHLEILSAIGRQIVSWIEQKNAKQDQSSLVHIFENSYNEIYIFESESLRFNYANKGARENLGYTAEDIQGLYPSDIIDKFSKVEFSEIIAPLRTGELAFLKFQSKLQRKDGTNYPVEVHIQKCIYNGQNAFSAIMLDVSAQKTTSSGTDIRLVNEINTMSLENVDFKTLVKKVLEVHNEIIPFEIGRFYSQNQLDNTVSDEAFWIKGDLALDLKKKTGIDVKKIVPDISKGSSFQKALKGGKTLVFQNESAINKIFQEHEQSPELNKNSSEITRLLKLKTYIIVPYVVDNRLYGLMTLASSVQISQNEMEQIELLNNQIIATIIKTKIIEEIQEQQKLTDTILQNLPVDISVFDKRQNYLYLNPRAVPDNEARNFMIGKTYYDYCDYKGLDPSLADERKEYFLEAVKTNSSVQWIDKQKAKNGLEKHILRRFHPYYLDGKLYQVISYGVDITDKQRTQNLLEEIADIQKKFIQNETEQGIFELLIRAIINVTESKFGFICEIDNESTQKKSLNIRATVNMSWNDEINDFYDIGIKQAKKYSGPNGLTKKIVKDGKPLIFNKDENDLRRETLPSEHPIMDSFAAIPIIAGNDVIGFVGVANRPGGYDDILINEMFTFSTNAAALIISYKNNQDRIHAEEQNRRLADIVSFSNDAIISSNNTGNVISWNTGAQKLFGFTSEETYEQPLEMFISSQLGEDQSIVDRILSGEFIENLECNMIKKGGDQFRVLLSSFSLTDDEGNQQGISVIIKDVSAQKEIEAQREEFTKNLEQQVEQRTLELTNSQIQLKLSLEKEKELGELKSRFVATASHQFRTPMSVIQSNAELFKLITKNSDVEIRSKLDRVSNRIQTEIKRMVNLMDDILILGKINAGTSMYLEYESVNIVDLCQKLIDGFKDVTSEKRKIKLEVSGKEKKISLDKNLIGHALNNLISNALKYSTDADPCIAIKFEKEKLILNIIDGGIGIPEEEIPNLFQPFHRAKNVGDIPGTGLGLAIVKEYIEIHGGEISVESKLNNGTTFTISLPYKTNKTD